MVRLCSVRTHYLNCPILSLIKHCHFTLALSNYSVKVPSLLTTLSIHIIYLLNILNNLLTYSLTLRWLASQLLTDKLLCYLLKQHIYLHYYTICLNNALPVNQPLGALNYNIYPIVLFRYIWGPSPMLYNVTLKKTSWKILIYNTNVYRHCSPLHCSSFQGRCLLTHY